MLSRSQLESMPKYNSFEFWFTYMDPKCWAVTTLERDVVNTASPVYTYNEFADIVFDESGAVVNDDIATRIRADFQIFKSARPEYAVSGAQYDLANFDQEAMVMLYETLIVGVALIRAAANGTDPDNALPKIYPCLDWLRNGDFYTAPASSVYHDSRVGGLLYHTLNVVNQIRDCLQLEKFKSVRIENAVLVALVHDWCKIGLYESYTRNVKNEQTGQWEKVPAFRRKTPILPLGHGTSSMFLARSYFRLTVDESLAIRWHMGEYNVANNEMNELHAANEQYPLVMLIQFADRLAITAY